MNTKRDEFHRLAASASRDWLHRLIVAETNDIDLALIVCRAADAISWHDMMQHAYKDTGIDLGNFDRNTYIEAPMSIYDELKRIV